jgi:hypothetical protein
MWVNDLGDELDNAFVGQEAPLVIEIRYRTVADIARLVKLAQAQTTTRQIALELRRTPLAVRPRASRMGLRLTEHEVRRSAKRHAKRKGKAAAAEVTNLRQRSRIAMTVDFDLSSLMRYERRQLAERLRQEDVEEGGGDASESRATPARHRQRGGRCESRESMTRARRRRAMICRAGISYRGIHFTV